MVIGDLLLGCDGVHSTVRTQLIDPDNHSEYSGVSFIQSLANANRATLPTQFDQTAIHLTRHGSLLTSYYNASHQIMFVAAIMPVNDFIVEQYRKLASSVQDDEMLKLTQMALRYQVRSKFGVSAFSWIREWIDKSFDWVLDPIYLVEKRGKWYLDRALLLGDAAHAMPPRANPPRTLLRTR